MKIKVSDILDAARGHYERPYLGQWGFEIYPHVTLEAPRGQHYSEEVSFFYVRVAAIHRGPGRRRPWAFYEQRIDGCQGRVNWRSELESTLAVARHRAAQYSAERAEARTKQAAAQLACIEYAAALSKALGQHISTSRVVMDGNLPVGLSVNTLLLGTPESVAETYKAVLALSAPFEK
jgi:hypothetical protein